VRASTTFDGWLKFHNPSYLTPPITAIIDFCCPGFLSLEASEEAKLIRAKRLVESRVKYIATIPADQARSRRWSGDSNLARTRAARLSRSSYFGVCEGKTGDDRGGVALELAAYRNPKTSGRVQIFDLNWSTNAEFLSVPKSHTFVFIFDIERFRAWCDPELFRQCSLDVESGQVLVGIPYSLKHMVINCALDLRRKDAQTWLCETFSRGYGTYWQKPLAGEIETFFAMFPTLFDMSLGGSEETQAIGYWLRANGVNALIYPSARCNAAVVYRGNEPESWFG
jgi:hypothetical protein